MCPFLLINTEALLGCRLFKPTTKQVEAGIELVAFRMIAQPLQKCLHPWLAEFAEPLDGAVKNWRECLRR